MPAHPTGAAVCELEVDPDTGAVELVNYTSVDDVGQPINPLIVEGQVHGGLAQGIGQALSEGFYMDRQTGQCADRLLHGLRRAARGGDSAAQRGADRKIRRTGNPLRVKRRWRKRHHAGYGHHLQRAGRRAARLRQRRNSRCRPRPG